jgi:hypothetical protein
MSTTSPHRTQSVVIRFPLRRVAILIARERDGDGWLALAGPHGWLFGSLADAQHEAKWLARNLGLQVRELRSVS